MLQGKRVAGWLIVGWNYANQMRSLELSVPDGAGGRACSIRGGTHSLVDRLKLRPTIAQ